MRPIDKGPWPTRKNSSKSKLVFNNWSRAINHLRIKTGEFCHLCEMAVFHQIAVEHLKSRDTHPRLSNSWTNFLLCCSHCNSSKTKKILQNPYRTKYFWPHIHNTLLAFEVPLTGEKLGVVLPSADTVADIEKKKRAENTIDLYELDKTTTADGAADRRYLLRLKAIQMATERRVEFQKGQATIKAIIDMASTTGYLTVWLEVFTDIPQVKNALLAAENFKLNPNWFDTGGKPIPRTVNDFF